MKLEIFRQCKTPWAIDGELRIAGLKVCDTSENTVHHLAPGTYTVRIERCQQYRRKMPRIIVEDKPLEANCRRCSKRHISSIHANLPCYCPQIKIGNGSANRTDGSILVGTLRIPGLILDSSQCFNRLIDRLDKAANRGEDIQLTILDNKSSESFNI